MRPFGSLGVGLCVLLTGSVFTPSAELQAGKIRVDEEAGFIPILLIFAVAAVLALWSCEANSLLGIRLSEAHRSKHRFKFAFLFRMFILVMIYALSNAVFG
jgi:hypothetical protein